VNFFLDHDVPAEVAQVLRQEAHEVIELRQVIPAHSKDSEVLAHASDSGLFLITCNRDDFLVLAADRPNPGIIVLVRRRSRHAECANSLALRTRAGESGLRGNINFA
jgi:predicted nuclease of predicted toxin-antitoxin system